MDIIVPDMPEKLSIAELPDGAPDWAVTLNDNIRTIAETMNSTMVTIDAIATEVQPMVDSLTKSPILKMFGGK